MTARLQHVLARVAFSLCIAAAGYVSPVVAGRSNEPAVCSLNGLWQDPVYGSPNAQLLFKFDELPDSGLTLLAVTTNGKWGSGLVDFEAATGRISVKLDDGEVINGIVMSCIEIEWFDPSGVIWKRVPQVKQVHVVFMNHLDVGYNGIPRTGFIANVMNVYFKEYFPRAIRLADEMQKANSSAGFVYTTHPWLLNFYFNCPSKLKFEPGILLDCPTPDEIKAMEDAIRKGHIVWHAGPMNMQIELMNEVVLKAGLMIAQDLDAKYGRKSTVLSQRDVPGMTAAVIPYLVEAGIKGVTVGVNPGSAPPAVPSLFQWRYGTDSIIAMWHAGGYPANPGDSISNAGGLSLQDCVIYKDQALAFAFRTDNSGPPPSIQEITSYYNVLSGEFPGAEIFASTFDNFIATIDMADLPVVEAEIGDTWIQGIASDPFKMALYRGFSAALQSCVDDKVCDLRAMSNITRFLMKGAEHTWGLPDVHDTVNWTNAAFQKAKDQRNYNDCITAWVEQLQYVAEVFALCEPYPGYILPYCFYFGQFLVDIMNPTVPNTDGYIVISDQKLVQLFNNTVSISIAGNGGLSSLQISVTDKPQSYQFASTDNSFGRFTYYTYNETDFQFMNSVYDYFGNAGYDKPNSTANAHPEQSENFCEVVPNQILQSNKNPAEIVVKLQCSQHLHENYGAPDIVWLKWTFEKESGKKNNNKSDLRHLLDVQLEVVMVDKTPTRLPEATMVTFTPELQDQDHYWAGYIEKISAKTKISLDSVIQNGSQYQHVAQGVTLTETDNRGNVTIRLSSLVVPLVCPVLREQSFQTPTPFPAPLTPMDASKLAGIAFNIHNNVWNTNYPLWYPYFPTKPDDHSLLYFIARFNATFYDTPQ